jgi:two-component system cell cycle sensor histidine kinase/response regulator CckA
MSTILLIEHDEVFAYAAAKALTRAGFAVVSAASAVETMKLVCSRRPVDLLLTSVRQPRGEPQGFALARIARLARADLAILYLSDLGSLEPEAHLALGTILKKPIQLDRLVSEVQGAIARHAAKAGRWSVTALGEGAPAEGSAPPMMGWARRLIPS